MAYPAFSLLEQLDATLRGILSSFQALLMGFLSAEHNSDGTHGRVTVSHLVVTSNQATEYPFPLKLTRTDITNGAGVYLGAVNNAVDPSGALYDNTGDTILMWDPVSAGGNVSAPWGYVVGHAGFKERARGFGLGEWQSVVYAAGNFTASAGAWTVVIGNQISYAYMLIGKTLFLQFDIETSDVTSGGAILQLAIPGGFVCAHPTRTCITAIDNGAAGATGLAIVQASGTVVNLYSTPAAAGWAATGGAHSTSAIGQIAFEVQ